MEQKHLQSLIKRNSNELNYLEYDVKNFKYHAAVIKEHTAYENINWNELDRLKGKIKKITELQCALKEELRHQVAQKRFDKEFGRLVNSIQEHLHKENAIATGGVV